MRYGLGLHPGVVRQSELEELIAHRPHEVVGLKQVVMIQCVRPEGQQEYCSRTCCTNTMKNAIRLKQLNPNCRVAVLYKDIITYGFREKYYREAARLGVLFVRYTESEPPRVEVTPAGLHVAVNEQAFGTTLEFEPDLLALSMAIVPSDGAGALARVLGVPRSTEGFFPPASCPASTTSKPSRTATSARRAATSSSVRRRKSKRWQRDRIVTGILLASVVAKMNLTCAGGSSSVFSRALAPSAFR